MRHRVFIDAAPVARMNMSGIGHSVLEIIRALDATATDSLEITLIIPFGARKIVRGYNFKHMRIRRLPPGYRGINYLLARTSLPIPVDLWFGRGTYLFMDYKNWYVPFSHSITVVHDLVFRAMPDTVAPRNRQYLTKNMKRWLGRTTTVLTDSAAAASEFEQYYPDYVAKLRVLQLGVDPAVFRRVADDAIAKAQEKYKLPERYFLFVGNVEPRKNLLTLLDGYAEYCAETDTPAALVLVGSDGWNNEKIWQKIRTLQAEGRKIIRPDTYVADADLPALYSGAQALFMPSLHEGFGLPAVQAQACGTPVVVSDLPVFREALRPQSTTFVLSPTPTGIAAALAQQTGRHYDDYAPLTWQQTAQTLIDLCKA